MIAVLGCKNRYVSRCAWWVAGTPVFRHTAGMSWLEPPPLVDKPTRESILPPGVSIKRIRQISYACMLAGGVVMASIAGVFIFLFWSTLSTIWVPILVAAFIAGAIIGFWMAAQAIHIGLQYGKMHQKQPPQV